ncbi:peptidyl-prolyl cis-trans isomerase FKBP7 isoform X3 [Cricetulus griseus]|uniref:peptidylprolyl isomerase n=1 Tax=Cricetulus griseus TaxID=10029 RepID=A0A9J7G8T9_CRIGR|nr:peptidyl-prolyl cis-trans isomerase FKBP7 isoform X3 [Cricetulus griseus]XP_027291414.1 peptidyl-prolyl cis-trans isomerase FKBP7 isoform X3 [Cricetulus griseus]
MSLAPVTEHPPLHVLKCMWLSNALINGLCAEGKIPPNATLMFEIELYAVTKGPRSIETFKEIDTDNDRQLSKAEIELYLQKDFEKDAKPRDKSYQNAVLEDIFKKNDHNRDGFISPKEYNVHQHDEL